MAALASQDDTIVPPLLSKLGIAQGTVREKAEQAVARLPKAVGGDEPRLFARAEQRRRERPALPEGPARRLPVGRAPDPGDEPAPRHRQRGTAVGVERGARQPPRHQRRARAELRRPGEVRAGPHRPSP
ncbi:MAG: hypothetical protein QM733_03355 [Ilumatobacteraceae bacterium]